MRLLTRNIPATCEIALLGDTHEGSATCYHDGIEAALDWVAAKRNRYFIHMGDEIDAICTDDKRYQHIPGVDPIPLRQAKAVVDQFRRVRTRGLVWLWGNHPEKLQRFGNLTRDIVCKELGIPYGTWTCKLRLMTGDRQVLKMFLVHGYRNLRMYSQAKDEEQQQANLMAKLKRALAKKAGDCLVMAMGHTHKLIVVPPTKKLILQDDGESINQTYLSQGDGAADYIEPDRRWYVNTGSYIKMYRIGVDSYAERAGYDPIELGHAVMKIRKGRLETIEKVYA